MKPDCHTTFAPPHSVRMWSDQNAIYAEVPAKDPAQPALVMRFERSDEGLNKALKLLAHRHDESRNGLYEMPTYQPKAKDAKGKPKPTEAQREAARQSLRKLGILA